MQRTTVAARAGRWSSQHRRAAILGWLAFVVVAVLVGGAIGTKHIPQDNNGVGESGRAQQILHDEFPQRANEQVLLQSAALTVRDPDFRAAIEDVTRRLSTLPTVQNVRSPLLPGQPGRSLARRPLGAGRLPDHGQGDRRGQARFERRSRRPPPRSARIPICGSNKRATRVPPRR